MINLAVINLKEIGKKLLKTMIITLTIAIIIKLIHMIYSSNLIGNMLSNLQSSHTEFIEETVCLSHYMNHNNIKKESNLKKILLSELAVFHKEKELMEKENQEEIANFENINHEGNAETSSSEPEAQNQAQEEMQQTESNSGQTANNANVPYTAPTKILEANNKTDTFTNNYESVKIKNESQYDLTAEMITPNIAFTNKTDIIIYHTHTCESYMPTEINPYQSSGNFRTTDLNYSVARVGTELTNCLMAKGLQVIHDTTYHDYPAYTGSYTRSLSTIKNILSQKPNAQLVIDLHRDALGSNSNYAPTVQIGDEVVAQVMFVMGTDGGGLEHPHWLNNLKLAIKVQEKANAMYPGLFKPIIVRDSRYNQHVTTGACIIEVGATGNTLEQCNASMKYLANVLAETLQME